MALPSACWDWPSVAAAAVLTELPRPAHLVYRRLLRPQYQAQRRWQPA
jgi:hypothetical protein